MTIFAGTAVVGGIVSYELAACTSTAVLLCIVEQCSLVGIPDTEVLPLL